MDFAIWQLLCSALATGLVFAIVVTTPGGMWATLSGLVGTVLRLGSKAIFILAAVDMTVDSMFTAMPSVNLLDSQQGWQRFVSWALSIANALGNTYANRHQQVPQHFETDP